MHQIFAGSDLGEADLAGLYAYPAGPWLRANMVSSADGAAHLEGATSGVSSPTDRRLFALLRTLADVIGAHQWRGTSWSDDTSRQAVRDDLTSAAAWAHEHGRHLLIGEFGTYARADMNSRQQWTRRVRL